MQTTTRLALTFALVSAAIGSGCTPQVAAPPAGAVVINNDPYNPTPGMNPYDANGANGQGAYTGGYDADGNPIAHGGNLNAAATQGQRGHAQGGRGNTSHAQGSVYDQTNRGQGANDAYAQNGGGQYTPADLRNPASILAQRIIYFDYDQSSIRSEYLSVLDAHASLLSKYPELKVRLEGHADERGTREYNVALSERRGYTVRDYLRQRGVRNPQMEIVGYGEEVPASLGHSERSWNQNRRVEIIYSGE